MPGALSACSVIDLPVLPEGASSAWSLIIDLPILSEGCKERLLNALSCTVGGLVNGLEVSNVEQYLNLLQEVYVIPPEDFDALGQKVREAVQHGPQLHVICKRARLTSISKRENLKVVAFILGKENSLLGAEVESYELTQAGNKEVALDLDGDLPLPRPGVEVVLRVEVRKAKS